MANPAFVQSSAMTTNAASSYGSPNTAGNLLIAIMRVFSGNTPPSGPLTDSLGNSWQVAVSKSTADNNSLVILGYVLNCKAGANTVTGHPSPEPGYQLVIAEYSGVSTLDQIGSGAAGSASASATSGVLTQQTELVVAGVGNSTSNTITYTAGGGFNLRQGASSTNMALADLVVTNASGSQSTAALTVSTSVQWAEVLATFYQISTASGGQSWVQAYHDFANKRGAQG